MSEIKLDAETGLPEIPETHWWEVRKFIRTQHFPYGYSSREVEDGYEVCLMTKVTVPPSVTPGRFWWEPARHIPEHVKDRVVCRKQIIDPALYLAWRDRPGSLAKVGKEFIEPSDVLKVAKDIVDMVFEAAEIVARGEASEGLLGVYPPNALEVSK